MNQEFYDAPSRTPTMVPASSKPDTLEQLQTEEQVKLLDKIDELRNQGLGHHGISLPQLIVCGDQSSGKSSLLEGLTRLRFPTKGGTCTAFASEVVLRHGESFEIICTIVPGKSRTPAQRQELSRFKYTYTSRELFNFHEVIENATNKMAFRTRTEKDAVEFYEDVLRIRYSGPDLPSLTIVDLPGLFSHQHSGGDNADKVAELVKSYMRNPKSVILAVVAALYDSELQRVMKYIKEIDAKGSRTLGIITKPDRVERGSEDEKQTILLARNEKLNLRHRWHVVRNRGSGSETQSDAERDEAEKKFFATGVWASLPRGDVGISTLRSKLSRVLLEHIGNELPSLVAAIRTATFNTQSDLTRLGDTRETSSEQRSYLTIHAEKFQMLTNDALRGIYSNPFFALHTPNEHSKIRLRTEIQNLNIAFAHIMYRKGHRWNIADSRSVVESASLGNAVPSQVLLEYDARFADPIYINRTEFLDKHIGDYVRQSRPSGLPSLVNPWVIGEVFRQQSQAWGEIAAAHLERVYASVKAYTEKALSALLDRRTCNMIMHKLVQPELTRRSDMVLAKLMELLVPYTEQDPITYDPGFVREIEETRAARYQAAGSQGGSIDRARTLGSQKTTSATYHSSRHLLNDSLDAFTNSEILDLMQTYYKVC